MSRPMRRHDRALSETEAWTLLAAADHGVLSTVDGDGQPYGVPVNHVVVGRCLYIHSAVDGHKLDNIEAQPKVSYCAIAHAEVEPAAFSTAYASVIATGLAQRVQDDSERRTALRALNARFAPGLEAAGEAVIDQYFHATAILRLDVVHLSAKARRLGSE